MKITIVAGARPNFMKIAPIIHAIEKKEGITYRLVHTGQHYNKNLSETFFTELNIPKPAVNLEVKSGSQATQTAAIMVAFEKDLEENKTDLVLVVGDVTSTMACAIVAKKAHVKVAHVEAGIRSGDLTMPEEINRMVTDSITDYFFTTSVSANKNLLKAGTPENRIFFVGNVMIDTLKKNLPLIKRPNFWDILHLKEKQFYVLTLHRPSNVDAKKDFSKLLQKIMDESDDTPVIFPVHPRTQNILNEANLNFENLHFVEPQGYLSFIYLIKNAKAVLTDSGGITEEASVLNIPCITFRNSTERPETCELGTNRLVGTDFKKIDRAFKDLKANNWNTYTEIPKWDGHTATRIVEIIANGYEQ
ncbi:non-hydrolyzing UDP-N-acetylglucosamine 2-epimerase [Marixanthomonas spongiae]|uniref:UDP-N-acetylglucosamine 2-epimerase (Non-hydrolyzing) n=1 Tax=Marixanthomonas spongiae TaxID=2174845 RepID=A0A2U0I204_9FLAO|nr:UDP-N-acetylglucosamine 2-epimerase (non-hydrolyzing) [Marixanthomonas spongiae]PVW15125.1 UDP-N-acetylglucosamine 2-epimerase (non-hydrolyzing) [Marixanthomonas spongiae]